MVFLHEFVNDENMENINDHDNEDHNNDEDTVHDDDTLNVSDTVDDGEQTVNDEPPPPQFTPPPTSGAAQGGNAEDRLVRDPHATFGGVLSGIAHRFGWDVSLTRLAFVVVLLLSGGAAIPAYLLAWLIIPRARFWPPMVRQSTRSLGGRDIGIGLIALAVLVVIAVGSGDAAAVIVPLALIAGGMWLLFQNPREAVASPAGAGGAAAMGGAGAFAFAPTETSPPMAGGSGGGWDGSQMPPVQPEPVESRSRVRRGVILTVLGLVILVPVLIVGGIVAAIASSDIDLDFEDATIVEPIGIDGIPTSVVAGSGEYTLDLSDTDLSPLFEDGAEPLSIAIDMDAGELVVVLPSDVGVEVDAEVDVVGDVTVFGTNEDGFGASVAVNEDDPELILDLSIDLGEIRVTRVG